MSSPLPLARPVPLQSRLDTGGLAWRSVAEACRAARHPLVSAEELDPARIALAYRSDRMLRIDGTAPDVWAPYSRFWLTRDGWMRTHGNYPHHARALRTALGVGDGAAADEVAPLIAARTTADSVAAITAYGGLAVPVLREDPRADALLRDEPLVESRRIGTAAPGAPLPPDAPLHRIRVLDLTRVIAGPVCTRTLALLGADVLRLDPPRLAEPQWQHLDTGHGKRSAILDARSERFAELLAEADVVVLGYRPAALDRLGLSPASLAARRPGIVVARLSAWGAAEPDRRGFDSLVQAASGIAMAESPDGETPGALPAQALDHSAGYLLAAAVCDALHRQRAEGGSWLVSTSLRRVAAELLGMPRQDEPAPQSDPDPGPHERRFTVGGREVVTVGPALPGLEFAAPRPWGADEPAWRSTTSP